MVVCIDVGVPDGDGVLQVISWTKSLDVTLNVTVSLCVVSLVTSRPRDSD